MAAPSNGVPLSAIQIPAATAIAPATAPTSEKTVTTSHDEVATVPAVESATHSAQISETLATTTTKTPEHSASATETSLESSIKPVPITVAAVTHPASSSLAPVPESALESLAGPVLDAPAADDLSSPEALVPSAGLVSELVPDASVSEPQSSITNGHVAIDAQQPEVEASQAAVAPPTPVSSSRDTTAKAVSGEAKTEPAAVPIAGNGDSTPNEQHSKKRKSATDDVNGIGTAIKRSRTTIKKALAGFTRRKTRSQGPVDL